MQCQGRGIDSKILILKLGGIGGGGGGMREVNILQKL